MKKISKDQETLAESFRSYLRKKNMSENTENAYGRSIRQFFSIESSISEDQLRKYRSFLISTYSPATINQRIFAINQFLLFLEEECPALDPTPAGFRLHSVKAPRDTFQDSIITNEDCEALQTKLKAEHRDFWYFVVRFLVTTGARVSELVQIKVEHLTCGYLDLYSKGGKIRRIYIPDSLCREAKIWCEHRGIISGFLFTRKNGRPVTTRGIHSQLKHYAIRYGIDPTTMYPHSFRHRFAKNFLSRSGDISLLADLLGHESIETTRIYLTRSSKEQKLLLDEMVTW